MARDTFVIKVKLLVEDMTVDEASSIVQSLKKRGVVIEYTIATASEDDIEIVDALRRSHAG